MPLWLQYLVYLVRLLVLGPSHDDGHSMLFGWALNALRVVLFLLITRRFIAPFILAKLSGRVHVRSISLRSIRGLYFRHGTFVLNLDRIGLSFHRPTKERPRRCVVKVEGLHITFLHVPGVLSPGAARTQAIHKRISSLFIPQPPQPIVAQRDGRPSILLPFRLILSWTEGWWRPLLRGLFVAGFRSLIRLLPALTQVLEFEMDSAFLSSEALRGAHIRLSGTTVSTRVAFEDLEHVIRGAADEGPVGLRLGSLAGMRARAGRLWERGWGNTRGAAQVSVQVLEIVGSTRPPSGSPAPITSPTSQSTPRAVGEFFAIRSPIELKAGVRFNPKLGKLDDHSVDSTLDLANIEIMADVLQTLFDMVEEAQLSTPSSPSDYFNESSHFSPPTSPLVGAWTEMRSATRSNSRPAPPRKTSSGVHRFLPLINNVRLGIQAISATMRTSGSKHLYQLSLDSLAVQASSSEPHKNDLHAKWLGSGSQEDNAEGTVLAFTSDIQSLAFRRSNDLGIQDNWMKLVSVTRINLRTVVTEAALQLKTPGAVFVDHVSSALVACEVIIDDVEITERLDAINESLAQASQRVKPPKTPSKKPAQKSEPLLPRLQLDLVLRNMDFHLIRTPQGAEDDEIGLHVHSDGFEVHADSSFARPSAHYAGASVSTPPAIPILSPDLFFSFTTIVEPIIAKVTISSAAPILRHSVEEPFFVLDRVELTVSGDAPTIAFDDGPPRTDISSLMAEAACHVDRVTIELWNRERVQALTKLAVSFKPPPPRPDAHGPTSTLMDALPRGVNARLAVPNIVLLVTGQDLNPTCDLELSRGIALRTSVTLAYSFMHAEHHFERTRHQRQRLANDRMRLGVAEDLLVQAVAKTRARTSPEDLTALIVLRIGPTVCQAAVATDYDVGQADQADSRRRTHSVDGPDIIFVPEAITGRFTVQRTFQKDFFNASHHFDVCEAVVVVPKLRVTYSLYHVYCLLIAAAALQKLAPKGPPKAPTPKKNSMQLLLTAKVEVCDLFCDLPSGPAFFRIEAVLLQQSAKYQRVGFHQLYGFVPHCEYDLARGKPSAEVIEEKTWDELLHVRTVTVSLTDTPALGKHVDVGGESLRLRIPSGYELANFIEDISLAIKTIKHMGGIVGSGVHSELPLPEPEDAKRVPPMLIRFESLLVEGEDLPLERRLNLIFQAGFDAQRVRMERELAFDAKCAAITRERPLDASMDSSSGRQRFTSKHTVSIEAARERLNLLHSNSWVSAFTTKRNEAIRREEQQDRRFRATVSASEVPLPFSRHTRDNFAPLVRTQISGLQVHLTQPSFGREQLATFLAETGDGLPATTQFSLLVPLHINASFMRGSCQIRDYNVPLLFVPQHSEPVAAFEFDTDLVIGEEMGPPSSIKHKTSLVVPANAGLHGAAALSFLVPKTGMPVKTYARPMVRVTTRETTHLGWGVSFMPAVQEVMRFLDSFTSETDDPSLKLGFWDKLRLIMHWQVRVQFAGPVQLNLKGSHDPHSIVGPGAGFAFRWQGGTSVTLGYDNPERELVQVSSDTMQLLIPDLPASLPSLDNFSRRQGPADGTNASGTSQRGIQKVCAKLTNGVRMGLGFVLERSCAPRCQTCPEDAFFRPCRHFVFKRHYEVQTLAGGEAQRRQRRRHVQTSTDLSHQRDSLLQPDSPLPPSHVRHDSFQGFRSDFIHMSFSLTSPIPAADASERSQKSHSNIYLSPMAFLHFWRWWHLFETTKTKPVRTGQLFPDIETAINKFGQALASIKYRFSIDNLFITHVYKADTRTTWRNGETPFIGVKALVAHLEADLHQSSQEATLVRAGKPPLASRTKRFTAANLTLSEVELRLLAAVFADPNKQLIALKDSPVKSHQPWQHMEPYDTRSRWVDMDDFVELLWTSVDKKPRTYLSHLASCPRFTYSKRSAWREPWVVGDRETAKLNVSKFGNEDTHVCLLGHQPSAKQVQLDLAKRRVKELKDELVSILASRSTESSPISIRPPSQDVSDASFDDEPQDPLEQVLSRKIELLGKYIATMESPNDTDRHDMYYMPAESVDASAWERFDNVYQVHCPNIVFNNHNRNLLYTYYQTSRRRRGFEFQLATRAVKFIQDMAREDDRPHGDHAKPSGKPGVVPHSAVDALRSLIAGERTSESELQHPTDPFQPSDPLHGWGEDAALSRSHYGIVIKPQVVMQSNKFSDACLIVAASDVSLQNFHILDVHNQDDPITGHIMSRNHAAVNGLQIFSPTSMRPEAAGMGTHNVPLEVLVDYRCESSDFDRLVPQTEMTLHYDKMNRNRPLANASANMPQHVIQQTDLVVVQMPRFSVAAKSKNFQTISSVVTDLLLVSDPGHHSRVEKLETFLFSYDFTDLIGAANLIRDLQLRIRQLIQVERGYAFRYEALDATEQLDMLAVSAQVLVLAEELSFVFDAIGAAQAQSADLHDDQLGLRLLASSKEISWNMLDDNAELLAKLVVSGIHFNWLNKQDSSTSSHLVVSDLRALHSSPTAIWPEILVKHDQPPNHHMVKRHLFFDAEWRVLPPVGGITIFENFQLDLHPIRMQIESEVGTRLLDYVWPARNHGGTNAEDEDQSSSVATSVATLPRSRGSASNDGHGSLPERGLARARSHTNLRGDTVRPMLHKVRSTTTLNEPGDLDNEGDDRTTLLRRNRRADKVNEASIMRSRSATKTFIRVVVPKVHVLLSARTDDFFCNEAAISTREQKWLNETTSFEELVGKFLPSDPTWKDWVKIALTQKVIPVLPVAKELFSKTKWGSKAVASQKNLLHPSSSTSVVASNERSERHGRKRSVGNSNELLSAGFMPRLARSRSRGPGPARDDPSAVPSDSEQATTSSQSLDPRFLAP